MFPEREGEINFRGGKCAEEGSFAYSEVIRRSSSDSAELLTFPRFGGGMAPQPQHKPIEVVRWKAT
ncbi:MAG: hypothetical protein ACTS40_01195 [Candidatus Hodgkinia cicadicola]